MPRLNKAFYGKPAKRVKWGTGRNLKIHMDGNRVYQDLRITSGLPVIRAQPQ
jgi:hypothetical protein